jgi:hypothetical protein
MHNSIEKENSPWGGVCIFKLVASRVTNINNSYINVIIIITVVITIQFRYLSACQWRVAYKRRTVKI